MAFYKKIKRVFKGIYYFFPIQLVILHLKQSHLLLLPWIVLTGFVMGKIATTYGFQYLFLAPEYMNRVNGWSYFIMGVVTGLFVVAYNISSYSANGSRFPFIATLSRPFLKYIINNIFFPFIFLLIYSIKIFQFHRLNEATPAVDIYLYLLFLYFGTLATLLFAYLYFFSTNKNIFTFFGIKKPSRGEPVHPNPKDLPKLKRRWWEFLAPVKSAREWRVETYLNNILQIRLARGYEHYDREMIKRVFNQNHLNATRFSLVIFALFLITSFFSENLFLLIPAGASVVLFFTIILMIITIIYSWFRGWAAALIILGILAYNYFSKYETLRFRNKAFGLNYDNEKAVYSYSNLTKLARDKTLLTDDIQETTHILEKWKEKNVNPASGIKKSRIVLIATSGGGLRSSLWTARIIQLADSALEGKLFQRTSLITGSSGGMVGAAYMRELYLKKQKGEIEDFYNDSILTNLSRDLLNPLSFSLIINDLFLRIQTFQDGNRTYTKDRGFAFETQLNRNTYNILNKRLKDYVQPEQDALIPMLILTPTIINDGRRLIISAQDVSYLTNNIPNPNVISTPLVEAIEFSRFFENQDALNLRFTTALRMNATFPFIMPVISLPSEPVMEILDAGNRDNYGLFTTLKFIYIFRQWLSENTDGIVIMQIRDTHKEFAMEEHIFRTPLENTLNPLGQFYSNTFKIQDYINDQLLELIGKWFEGKIEIVSFQLRNEGNHKISLSWHLTDNEKEQIYKSVELPENRQSLEKLRALLD